ncbi:hypothetical protein ABZ949_02475 [Micromonospora tulbaghiae]|uniref:hypothetical protein n=1 Tax=Micromonospora tulbaghiae TaxID=479978 RepID=UPI0033E10ACF
MTARLRSLVGRLPWTPRQLVTVAAIAVVDGVAFVLGIAAIRSSRYGEMTMFVYGLAIVFLLQLGVGLAVDLLRERRRSR